MDIRIEDLYWVAGFLEGEGSFGKNSGTIYVSAVQVQKEPIDRLYSILKCGSIGTFSRKEVIGNLYHRWQAHGEFAEHIMKIVYPIMSPRRKSQIMVSLEWYNSRPGKNWGMTGRKTCRSMKHEWNDENTYINSRGARTCRICDRENKNDWQRAERSRIKEQINK